MTFSSMYDKLEKMIDARGLSHMSAARLEKGFKET